MRTYSTYLPCGSRADLHDPGAPGGCGLVIVPPFGLEDVASYRGRRAWAAALAQRGHAVLRLELRGQGDSAGSPDEDGLFDRWVASITTAARELRAAAECGRIAVLGMGLGGMLAWLSADAGGPIDDLALWAVPSRGRSLLREMRAFAAVQGAMPPTPQADGTSWFYGYPLPAAVIDRLEATDLAAAQLRLSGRRVLLLGRDRLAPDRRLVQAARSSGAQLEVGSGDGYSVLVESPQTSKSPAGVFDRLAEWLGSAPPPAGAASPPSAPNLAPRLTVAVGITEEVVSLPGLDGTLSAVVTTPAEPGPVTIVLLNAGGNRRTGPGRLWVQAARAAAAAGATAVRVDLPGIGDSGGPPEGYSGDADYYTPEMLAEVPHLLSELGARGLPPRFVLAGLCSGAYWAVTVAASDPRVVAAVGLNPGALVWEPWRADVGAAHDIRRLRRPATWLRIVTGRVSRRHAREIVRALLKRLLVSRRTLTAGNEELAQLLDALDNRGIPVVLAFSTGEPLLDELTAVGVTERIKRSAGISIRPLGGPAGSHTLPVPDQQREALAAVAETLQSVSTAGVRG